MPKNVILPNADEAKPSTQLKECSITVTAEEYIILGTQRVHLADLERILRVQFPDPRGHSVELRGDQDAPYEVVQRVLQQIAQAGISRVHFATRTPYERELTDEGPDESNE